MIRPPPRSTRTYTHCPYTTLVRSRDGLVAGRGSRGGPSWRSPMAKAPQKLVLSGSRDIPFDRLHLSQSNVRRVKAGVSIGELAEDKIGRASCRERVCQYV